MTPSSKKRGPNGRFIKQDKTAAPKKPRSQGKSKRIDVMPAEIEALIKETVYHTVPGTNLTICTLVLTIGWTYVGTSSAVHRADFDGELGKKLARESALEKLTEAYIFHRKLVAAQAA